MKVKVFLYLIFCVFTLSLCCCSNLFDEDTDEDYTKIGSNNSEVSSSKPSTPTGLTATLGSYGGVTITWNAVSGATSYKLYYASSYSGFTSYNYYTVTSTSYYDSISSGTSRYYKVSAVNANGESAKSTYDYVTYSVPLTPTGLTATLGSYGGVTITWNAVSGATSYKLYYASSYSGFTSYNYYTVTSTSYYQTISSGTSRYYKVSAVNANGESTQSTYDYVTYTSYSVPSTPTGLTATLGSYGSVTITWNAVSGATSYKLYYASSSTGFTSYNYYTVTSTSYYQTISSGTSRYYKVSAVNANGESAKSSYDYVIR